MRRLGAAGALALALALGCGGGEAADPAPDAARAPGDTGAAPAEPAADPSAADPAAADPDPAAEAPADGPAPEGRRRGKARPGDRPATVLAICRRTARCGCLAEPSVADCVDNLGQYADGVLREEVRRCVVALPCEGLCGGGGVACLEAHNPVPAPAEAPADGGPDGAPEGSPADGSP